MPRLLCLCLLAATACTQSESTSLRVSFSPPAIGKEAVLIELALVQECPSESAWTAAAVGPFETLRVARDAETAVRFSTVVEGKYAIQARAIAADCAVVASVCTAVTFSPAGGTRDVVLEPTQAPVGCGSLGLCDLEDVTCDCNDGAHDCGGTCVSNAAPESCGDRCEPCAAVEHAEVSCEAEECAYACDFGFTSCDSGCCPTVATEELAPTGEALAYPLMVVDGQDRPHVFAPSGIESTTMRHGVRTAEGWEWQDLDSVTALTDSMLATVDAAGTVHATWSFLGVGASRVVKYAKLEGATPTVEVVTPTQSSVLAFAVYDDAPWLFVQTTEGYFLYSRGPLEVTWSTTEVTFPFAVQPADLIPAFTGPGELSMLVRDRGDCVTEVDSDLCAIHSLTVDGGTVSDPVATGYRTGVWESFGNSRREHGVLLGDTFQVVTFAGRATGDISATLGWLSGGSAAFALEPEIVSNAVYPAMVANRDGTELWLTYNDGATPIPDGGGRVEPGVVMLARHRIEGPQSEWAPVEFLTPVGTKFAAFPSIAFDSEGGAHVAYLRLDTSGEDFFAELSLEYAYIPAGGLDD